MAIAGLIHLLIVLVILGVILWICCWAISRFRMPPPINVAVTWSSGADRGVRLSQFSAAACWH